MVSRSAYSERKAGFGWRQEEPNQIIWSPLDEPSRTLERGARGLHRVAARGSRIPVGHPEGMLEAFANIYGDLHAAIAAARAGRRTGVTDDFPGFDAGLEMVRVVEAATTSVAESRTVDDGLIEASDRVRANERATMKA